MSNRTKAETQTLTNEEIKALTPDRIDWEATKAYRGYPLSRTPKEPSIADYLPMVYIAIAIVFGAIVAVKLYKGAKKRVKPFKVEVKASVSVTKPDSEESD